MSPGFAMRVPIAIAIVIALAGAAPGSARAAPARGLALLAGAPGGPGSLDGPDGRLRSPGGIAIDPAGRLYVLEAHLPDPITLRSIDPATGTIAPAGEVARDAYSILFDAAGNRYDVTINAIYKTTPGGTPQLFVGTGTNVMATVDGVGTRAGFSVIGGATVDAAGNLFVSDSGTIRRVSPAGVVVTLAGAADNRPALVDGAGRAARFQSVGAVAVDRNGTVFNLDGDVLRKMAPDGTVTTPVLKAALEREPVRFPNHGDSAAVLDTAGNLYVAVTAGGCRILRVAPDGIVTTLAGSPAAYGYVDGKGDAARFCAGEYATLGNLVVDRHDNLYVSDPDNHVIRRIAPDGTVTTVAGRGVVAGNLDGQGAHARFALAPYEGGPPASWLAHRYSLAPDAHGNVYVGEGDRIRKVTPDGGVTTLPLPASGWPATTVYPASLAFDGSVLVVENTVVWRIDAAGRRRLVAGHVGPAAVVDGVGAAAGFHSPHGLIADGRGNIWLHDVEWRNPPADGRERGRGDGLAEEVVRLPDPAAGARVVQRRIAPDGTVTTLPPAASPIRAWCADADGNVWAAHEDDTVSRMAPDGTRMTVRTATSGEMPWIPTAIARDTAGNLYLGQMVRVRPGHGRAPDWHVVRSIAPDGREAIVAGVEGPSGLRPGAPGNLGWVDALAAGPDGIVYVMSENALLTLVP